MSMPKKENSVAARFARWMLGCAVRYWPAENRAWGLALAAEIDETASAFETVRWSLGGIMLFTRSILSSAWKWMKLPAGGSLSGGAGGPEPSSQLPKRSRVFTAAVFAAAGLLLGLPEGREAIRTVRASWQKYRQSDSDARTLEKLAVRAEKEKDAGKLAFVALSTGDSKRAEVLMERAVALDPQLVWVYGSRDHWPNYEPPKAEWLVRLQEADPNNAVPYLLAADALSPLRSRPFYQHGIPKDSEFEVAESDLKWMALMERAYGTQRYDSYFQRHYQLTRTVWNGDANLSPVIVLSGLRSHAIPDLGNLDLFADIKIHEAQKARAVGDLKRAERLLGEVDAFSIRMADGSETKIEKLVAWRLSRSANKEMAVLYSSWGKTEEELRVTQRIKQLEANFQAMMPARDLATAARVRAFRRDGILVQGFGTVAVIAGFAALAGVLVLELWPLKIREKKTSLRRVACLVVDYAPSVLLIGCGTFLLSFLPIHRAFEEYRASIYSQPNDERLMDSMWGLLEIPRYLTGVNFAVSVWTIVTITLSTLLLLVLVRGFYRMRHSLEKAA